MLLFVSRYLFRAMYLSQSNLVQSFERELLFCMHGMKVVYNVQFGNSNVSKSIDYVSSVQTIHSPEE